MPTNLNQILAWIVFLTIWPVGSSVVLILTEGLASYLHLIGTVFLGFIVSLGIYAIANRSSQKYWERRNGLGK